MGRPTYSAMQILNERFAKGEIQEARVRREEGHHSLQSAALMDLRFQHNHFGNDVK